MDDEVEIFHVLSGKQFRITNEVYRVLLALKSFKSVRQLKKLFGTKFSEDILVDALVTLEINGIIITNNSNESFNVLQSVGLFGFKPHNQSELGKTVILGIPYGNGNGIDNNCSLYPHSIRSYLRGQNAILDSTFNSKIGHQVISRQIDFQGLTKKVFNDDIKDWGDLHFSRMEDTSVSFNKIYEATKEILKRECVPFFLGGDHSITYPILKATQEKYTNLIVFQFDAHRDIYENRVDAFSIKRRLPHHGNFILNCIKLPKLKRIYQFGIRGLTSLSQRDFKKLEVIYESELNDFDASKLFLDKNAPIYITFDIDFLNPSIAPGTATPVPGGLSFEETCGLFSKLLTGRRIVGVDIVEINPKKDLDSRTLQLSAQVILALLNFT